MDTQELIIPVRFNYQGASSDLKAMSAQAEQSAKKSADAQANAQKDAEKRRIQAAKEAAALIAQAHRDLAEKSTQAAREAAKSQEEADREATASAKQAATEQSQAAMEAGAAKKQAARGAFVAWKASQDAQHRQAMQSWAEQQAATKKAEQEAKQFSDQIGGLTKAMVSLTLVKGVVGAIAERMNEASEYTRNAAKDFIAMRHSMQEVATLSGKANNNQFTVDEAKKAQAAHLDPKEYRDFKAEYLNYAGSQVSSDETLGEGQKLTASQSEEYASRVAEFMKAGGIDPKKGAQLAGSVLEQSNGGESVDQLMGHFSKAANVSEKGNVPFAKAAQDLSQIMSMGVSAEDAAKMYAVVSPAAAGEEGTSVQAALRATQEMKNKGTGEEFGVRRGMGQYDAVKAFAGNITQRKADLMAAGKTDQEASDEVQALLAEKGVAADHREARGLVRGFGRMGVEKGLFRRFEAIEAGTSEGFEADRKKKYEDSEEGQQAKRDADSAVKDIESGNRNVKIAEIRQDAENELKNEKRFERVDASDYARGAIAKAGGTSVKDQLINERAIQIAQDRGGVPQSERMLTNFGASNKETDEKILKAMERQTEIMEKAEKRDDQKAAPALGAPMPPGNRRQ